MSQREKFLTLLLRAQADQNIPFEALCRLLSDLGFAERVRGSHHIYTREGVEEIINLQPVTGNRAKPYQVKQVRNILIHYQLV